jgi:hypothetical protein
MPWVVPDIGSLTPPIAACFTRLLMSLQRQTVPTKKCENQEKGDDGEKEYPVHARPPGKQG